MRFITLAGKWFTGLAVGFALLSANVSATVLVNSPPYKTALVGEQADVSVDLNDQLVETITLPPDSISIKSFTWWGFDTEGLDVGLYVNDFVLNVDGTVRLGTVSIGSDKTTITTVLDTGESVQTELLEYILQLNNIISFTGGDLEVILINNNEDVQWFWQGTTDAGGPRAYRIEGDRLDQNVPEPGALVLFGLALAGLALVRRQKHFR